MKSVSRSLLALMARRSGTLAYHRMHPKATHIAHVMPEVYVYQRHLGALVTEVRRTSLLPATERVKAYSKNGWPDVHPVSIPIPPQISERHVIKGALPAPAISRAVEDGIVAGCAIGAPRLYCLRPLSATSHHVAAGLEQLRLQLQVISQPLSIGIALISRATLSILVEVRFLEMVDAIVFLIHRPNVSSFQIISHRFHFPVARATTGSANKSERTSTDRLDHVRELERAPEFEDASLVDRLRWILTPPINQLVSDLSVPARPYPFQLQGIGWLMERESALLADEMGLGKTMQAIIAARLLWREHKIEQVLVICPKSLLANWRREFGKWWPDVLPHLFEPPKDKQWFLRLATPNVVVKLINYEALPPLKEWLSENAIEHDLVIIDEAQRIKSPTSKTSIAVKQLRGKRCWALTGTPLENSIEDLISILEFVKPELANPLAVGMLRSKIKPYILRRRTDDPDVNLQLPDKIEQDIEIELTPEQRARYELAESEGVVQLNSLGDEITRTHIFALIRQLTQICNFDPVSGNSAKLEQLLEDLDDSLASGKKTLVFSQFTSDSFGLKHVARQLAKERIPCSALHGEIPMGSRERIIENFNTSPTAQVLLLNYKVGGVGLNLQAASYVCLFDRWWNPAVEDQAAKRAHRIGQKDKVIVRRFFCPETIEQRILAVLARKRILFHQVIDQDREPELSGLTDEELFSLFKLKMRPRKSTYQARRLSVLTPSEFEQLVAELYTKQGYSVQHIGGRGDGGIDVLAERQQQASPERLAIQCKHVSRTVGPEDVRSLWGVVNHDQRITAGILVTSSVFSGDARSFARDKRLYLMDRRELLAQLRVHGIDIADD